LGTNTEKIEKALSDLLESLGVDLKDENFVETPKRVAAYLCEHFVDEDTVKNELSSYKRAMFPSSYEGAVYSLAIHVNGMCPHHMLPINYTIHLGYLPKGHMIGLSKLGRIAETLGRLPILQEELTDRIAAALRDTLDTPHVAVLVKGEHACMKIRGIEQSDCSVKTCTVCGKFLENDAGLKDEFFMLVNNGS